MKIKVLLLSLICFLSSLTPKKELTWMAIGDSITYMDSHHAEAGNRITKGYMTRVAEKLPYIRFTNHGRNGWTALRMAESIETLGLQKGDIYSVFLGTNDWNRSSPIGTFDDYQNNTGNKTLYGAFRMIINKVRSLNPDGKIILITPMQRVDFVSLKNPKNNQTGSYKDRNGHYLSEYADAVNTIAKAEKFQVVDLYYKSGMTLTKMVKFKRLKDPKTGEYRNYKYPDFVGIPFDPATDEYPYPLESIGMTYDGLHPSDKGYAVIAKMLVKIMKKY